jgi:hypothetical protein
VPGVASRVPRTGVTLPQRTSPRVCRALYVDKDGQRKGEGHQDSSAACTRRGDDRHPAYPPRTVQGASQGSRSGSSDGFVFSPNPVSVVHCCPAQPHNGSVGRRTDRPATAVCRALALLGDRTHLRRRRCADRGGRLGYSGGDATNPAGHDGVGGGSDLYARHRSWPGVCHRYRRERATWRASESRCDEEVTPADQSRPALTDSCPSMVDKLAGLQACSTSRPSPTPIMDGKAMSEDFSASSVDVRPRALLPM